MKMDDSVWLIVKKQFPRQWVKREIVRKMVECRMWVSDDDRLYVADVEVSYCAMARALNVDRRVVKQTLQQIRRNPQLTSAILTSRTIIEKA